MRGLVTEIRRFATHDGPGIRTTVFLKGCPLRCSWCANPETLARGPELRFRARRCRACGACVAACPAGALSLERPGRVDRTRCEPCRECVAACPNAAYEIAGRELSVDGILAVVERDRPFYEGGGGLTLCGGEPLLQAELALGLLAEARERGLSPVLDTCGHAPARVIDEAARLADLVLLDVKHLDPEAHRRGTGADNALILDSARRFAARTRVRVCVPLVPGYNDGAANLEATAAFAAEIGAEAIDLLPVHALGWHKYAELGLPEPAHVSPAPAVVAEARRVLEASGLPVTVGRML